MKQANMSPSPTSPLGSSATALPADQSLDYLHALGNAQFKDNVSIVPHIAFAAIMHLQKASSCAMQKYEAAIASYSSALQAVHACDQPTLSPGAAHTALLTNRALVSARPLPHCS